MPSLTIRWRSMHDGNVCPVCQELDAVAEWVFTDSVPSQLEWKGMIVWDEVHGSDAHGHHRGGIKCRCHLEPQLDLSDIKARLEQILANVKEARGVEQPSV